MKAEPPPVTRRTLPRVVRSIAPRGLVGNPHRHLVESGWTPRAPLAVSVLHDGVVTFTQQGLTRSLDAQTQHIGDLAQRVATRRASNASRDSSGVTVDSGIGCTLPPGRSQDAGFALGGTPPEVGGVN